MYMFYNLKWRLKSTFGRKRKKTAAHNAYILALDGDVDFEPEAVLSLIRRMQKSDKVGAACGRIHPIGSGNICTEGQRLSLCTRYIVLENIEYRYLKCNIYLNVPFILLNDNERGIVKYFKP